jgi:hypothetical protein
MKAVGAIKIFMNMTYSKYVTDEFNMRNDLKQMFLHHRPSTLSHALAALANHTLSKATENNNVVDSKQSPVSLTYGIADTNLKTTAVFLHKP